MYVDDPKLLKRSNKCPVRVKCDSCGDEYESLYDTAQSYLKRQGRHLCLKCRPRTGPKDGFWTAEKRQAHSVRIRQYWTDEKRQEQSELVKYSRQGTPPQCTKEFWTEEKRQQHSRIMLGSEKLHQAHAAMDRSGAKNGMFGRKMSPESRAKMSRSRTGKFGPNATAWKGGKTSLLRRLKKAIHERFEWYLRVFRRDGWHCQQCGSNKKVDAHHIKPLVCIVKELCQSKTFSNEMEKFEWLLEQSQVCDHNLENGVTLCRCCHKAIHANWGSHYNP